MTASSAPEMHAFMGYNKPGIQAHAPVLCGNWVEEAALKEATGASRYQPWVVSEQESAGTIFAVRQDHPKEQPTGLRVFGEMGTREWTTMQRDSFRPAGAAQTLEFKPERNIGPKAKLALAAMQKAAADLPPEPKFSITRGPTCDQSPASIYQADFVDKDLTVNTIGARCMKDRDGRPAVRDPTFLAETQLVPRAQADRIFGETAKLAGATQTLSLPDPDVPITVYSEAVATHKYGGNIAGTRTLSSKQPFGKFTNFTKPMNDYSKVVDDE